MKTGWCQYSYGRTPMYDVAEMTESGPEEQMKVQIFFSLSEDTTRRMRKAAL